MSYGQPLDITIPAAGAAFGLTGAGQINSAIQTLQGVLETKVTPAGFTVNSDMSFKPAATAYGLTGLHRASMDALSALLAAATYPRALFTYGGELYYNDASSRQIQITNAGTVNSAAGNITGAGYGTGGVEVNWDSGNNKYRMRSGSGTNSFADVEANDFYLHAVATNNTIRIACPALAGDRTYTLPAAAPGSTSLVQMDSGGILSVSNTVANALTLSSTLGVTGLITATGGLTAAAGQHVVVSTTGRFKHGNLTKVVNLGLGVESAGGTITDLLPGSDTWNWGFGGTSDSSKLAFQLDMVAGERIRQIDIVWDSLAAGTTGVITHTLYTTNTSGDLVTTGFTANSVGGGDQTVTIASIDTTVVDTTNYVLRVDSPVSWDRNFALLRIVITYDRP